MSTNHNELFETEWWLHDWWKKKEDEEEVEIGKRACPIPVIGRVDLLPTMTARREVEGETRR
jgi:hypothetical protein